METLRKVICQSCGMPMYDESDFGTEKDGSFSEEYCNFCYQRGRFTDAGITLVEKIEKNIEIAVKLGMPREEASAMARTRLPKLKRWVLKN